MAMIRRGLLPGFLSEGSSSDAAMLSTIARAGRRDLSDRVYASDAARAYAEETAKALQSQLASGFPSFVKLMLQSHVTGGFWLVISRALGDFLLHVQKGSRSAR